MTLICGYTHAAQGEFAAPGSFAKTTQARIARPAEGERLYRPAGRQFFLRTFGSDSGSRDARCH